MKKLRKTIALILGLMIAISLMPQAVLGAGFDGVADYTTELNPYFHGWGNWSAATLDHVKTFYCVTDEIAHSGNNSVVIRHTDSRQNWKAVILAQEGLSYGAGTYTFSFWAAGNYANNLCGMSTNGDWWDDFYLNDFTIAETDGDWTKYTVDFTVPLGKTQNAITIMSNGNTEGWFIDDISFVKVGTTENLLKNTSFEETEASEPEEPAEPTYTDAYAEYAYGWGQWYVAKKDDNTYFSCVTNETAHSGDNSFILRHTDPVKNFKALSLVQEGLTLRGTYTLSFWAKGIRTDVDMQCVTLNGDAWTKYPLRDYAPVETDGEWSKYTFDVTVPNGKTNNTLVFCSDGQTEGWYLDDISLVVKGTTENLLKNTSFEEKEGGAEEPEEPEIPAVPTYTTEFEDYFYGWERETAIAENGSTIFTCVTDGIAHSGNNSFVLRSLDTGDKDLMIKQTGLGLGEGTYTFSFWATGTVADHDNDSYRYQQIVWLEGLDPSYRYVTDMTTGETKGGWRKYTLEFTVPGGLTVNAIKLSTRGHGTEGLYVDDFSLVKNGTTENLIVNGGFEEVAPEGEIVPTPIYTDEYEDYFTNWTRWDALTPDENLTFSCVTNDIAYSGSNSFVIRHVDSANSMKAITLAQSGLTLTGTYKLSFWAVGIRTDIDMQCVTLNGEEWVKYPLNICTAVETDGIWSKYELEVTVPEGKTNEAIAFSVDGDTNGWYIDDISLVRDGTAENLIKNGDFEERNADAVAGDVVREVILKKNGQRTDSLMGKGDYSVTLILNNYAIESKLDVEQFVAIYDQDGVLYDKVYSTAASVEKATADGAFTKIETNFALPEGKYTVEYFLFDGRETLNIIGSPNPHRIYE